MKRMKLLLSIVLVALSLESQAQSAISVGFTGTRNTINTTELNTFVESFNEYHKGDGFVPMKPFVKGMYAPGFNFGWRYLDFEKSSFYINMMMMFSWDSQKTNTTLIQKSGYDFTYRSSNIDFLFELGYSIKSRVLIGAVAGLGISDESMEIWKIYANGDRSITNENDLPGYYQGSAYPISYGAVVSLRLGKFLIPFRVMHASKAFSNTVARVGFTDYSNSSRYRSTDLPLDYGKWAHENQSVAGIDNYVDANIRTGWRFQIGVEYLIPTTITKKQK